MITLVFKLLYNVSTYNKSALYKLFNDIILDDFVDILEVNVFSNSFKLLYVLLYDDIKLVILLILFKILLLLDKIFCLFNKLSDSNVSIISSLYIESWFRLSILSIISLFFIIKFVLIFVNNEFICNCKLFCDNGFDDKNIFKLDVNKE